MRACPNSRLSATLSGTSPQWPAGGAASSRRRRRRSSLLNLRSASTPRRNARDCPPARAAPEPRDEFIVNRNRVELGIVDRLCEPAVIRVVTTPRRLQFCVIFVQLRDYPRFLFAHPDWLPPARGRMLRAAGLSLVKRLKLPTSIHDQSHELPVALQRARVILITLVVPGRGKPSANPFLTHGRGIGLVVVGVSAQNKR